MGVGFSIHALLAESDTPLISIPKPGKVFSIHALLAESDGGVLLSCFAKIIFLSTLSLRRATEKVPADVFYQAFLSTLSLRRATHYDNYNLHCVEFSIHALLAESDWKRFPLMCFIRLFYPRSPCGERLLSLPFRAVRIVFYPRSPCGERRFNVIVHSAHPHFLSTLSLRRATPQYRHLPEHPQFSIHALLAESDTEHLLII